MELKVVWGVLWLCLWGTVDGAVRRELTELQLFRARTEYKIAAIVLLGEAPGKSRSPSSRDVGYRLEARLDVRPRAIKEHEILLEFQLKSPKLMARGKHARAEFLPRASMWDEHPHSVFAALWRSGRIEHAYLPDDDHPDVSNFKKALISVFQFQVLDGEYNETDISGACKVQYETLSEVHFHKLKRECEWEGITDLEEDDSDISWRRMTHYTLDDSLEAFSAIHAEEALLIGEEELAARALLTLELTARDGVEKLPELEAALEALESNLKQQSLVLVAPPDEETEKVSLESAIAENRAALEEESVGEEEGESGEEGGGSGASVEEATRGVEAALRLLPVLRHATKAEITAVLENPDNRELLPGLCRLVGAAGTRAGLGAVRAVLQLSSPDPPLAALAKEYYAALSLAPEPEEWVVSEVLKLGGGAGPLSAAALLAGARAVSRVLPPERADKLSDAYKQTLTSSLAKCKDDTCRAVRLQALGMLEREDSTPLLLEHAERSPRSVSLAALGALAQAKPRLRHNERERLERIVLSHTVNARSLETRAAALELLISSTLRFPAALAHVTSSLRAHGPRELRRVCRQRLLALAPNNEELRHLLRALDPRPNTWHDYDDGTSQVLQRGAGAGWAGWRARLDSSQLAHNGLLRRGRVALYAQHASNATRDLLAVEVWTRGLDSLASSPGGGAAEVLDEGEGEAEGEEEMAAGLALTVADARLPDVTLFTGQGELLGHIWSGTGSAWTPALRALVAARSARSRRALLAGVPVAVRAARAATVALDAQAQVSLWGRTARAALRLRGAVAAQLEAALRAGAGWGGARARVTSRAAPALRLAASLDFYDKPQLCVRTHTDDHVYTRNVTLESSFGSKPLRVLVSRATSLPAAGRTLSLGARNDAACRALPAH